jgi:hypothetical protein
MSKVHQQPIHFLIQSLSSVNQPTNQPTTMVKFALASIALMAVSLPFSLADNCTPGIRYCGYNLLAKGGCSIYYTYPSLENISTLLT